MPEILGLAKALALDTDKLQADMNRPDIQLAIQKNRALAQALGITGTPVFIIGTELVPGAIDAQAFKELIGRVRTR
jgi:protein-disulfide isomerase